MESTKYLLGEQDIPTAWYNIQASMPHRPQPVLHPGTGKPIGPEDLGPLFPMALIQQEVSTERFVAIPGPILDVYRLWRPTPLHRARRFELALGTPARIYYKYEGVSPAGSHKPNTAKRPILRLQSFRLGVQSLYGPGELRAKTLPSLDDGSMGWASGAQPEPGYQGRTKAARDRAGDAR